MAKRWASSRRRWTRYRADDVGGSTIGSGAAGQEQLLALLGQAGQRQVVQPELVEDRLGRADLALAAVDDDEVRHRPAALLLAALLARPGHPEPAAQDLLVAGEVVRALRPVLIRNRRYSPLRGLPSSNTTMLPTDSLPWKFEMS